MPNYAVGVVSPNGDAALDYAGRALLEELAFVSGGKALFPSSGGELDEDIGFAPSAAAKRDGRHEVSVKVGEARVGGRQVKVYARTRAGFYDVPPPRRATAKW